MVFCWKESESEWARKIEYNCKTACKGASMVRNLKWTSQQAVCLSTSVLNCTGASTE